MTTTTVRLPEGLKLLAERAAQSRGISLEQFIRQSLKEVLGQMAENDSLFVDRAVFRDDGPSDFAVEHDRYLYGGLS